MKYTYLLFMSTFIPSISQTMLTPRDNSSVTINFNSEMIKVIYMHTENKNEQCYTNHKPAVTLDLHGINEHKQFHSKHRKNSYSRT